MIIYFRNVLKMKNGSDDNVRIIVSIGSNTEQCKNINYAKKKLNDYFHDMKYSSAIWTNPIDITSEQFLNCLGIAETNLKIDEIIDILKQIEISCGSSHEEHNQGIVKIDLDLLLYGNTKFHILDWERLYIRELLKEL